jgi:hypothetical protein
VWGFCRFLFGREISSHGLHRAFHGFSHTLVCIHKDHEGHDHDDDRGLRIASVFIVLVASFAGAVLPVLTKRFCPDLDQIYYSCGKVFGAGIILSTAFVHMFSPANLVSYFFEPQSPLPLSPACNMASCFLFLARHLSS